MMEGQDMPRTCDSRDIEHRHSHAVVGEATRGATTTTTGGRRLHTMGAHTMVDQDESQRSQV